MIRRARLSFKPNVRPSGRASGCAAAGSSGGDGVLTPQPEPVHESEKDSVTGGPEEGDKGAAAEVALAGNDQEEPIRTETGTEQHEKTAPVSNDNQSSKASSAPLQRRKRISTLPNLAKPRVSNCTPVVAPSQKPPTVETSSALPASNVPVQTEVSSPDQAKLPSPPKSQALLAASPGEQQATLPEKRTPVPQVPQFSPYKKSVLKNSDSVSPVKTVEGVQRDELSPLKERPSQKSLNENFMTNKQITHKKTIVGNLEKERLRRSQKLRELLKDELRKERKKRKEKLPVILTLEEPERSKMTMRDFIHFIPTNNPMTSSHEETKTSEKSPTESQVPGPMTKPVNDAADDDDVNEEDGDDEDSQLLAPRVKVAEDGSIILDEESLTVEVIRNKAPIVEGNDPIFERGSTTTYSSFRRSNYSKPWSDQETDMFFLAISMVGTDFSMIGQLFPHRERIEIKNKFKREERSNGWRIDKAFREKKSFDFEFFADLLEKALEAGKKKPRRPRIKQPSEKKANKKVKDKKTKDKSAEDENVNGEEAAILSEGETADASTAEKENKESQGVEECQPASEPVSGKKRRTRKKKDKKEPEEEKNDQDQCDDLPAPKKKESKKKKKTAVESKGGSPEAESAANDKNLEGVKAEKKRVRKKKPRVIESEVENQENTDADLVKGSKRKKRNKKICDVPKDNTAEGDLSLQSAALPEEETSLVLFPEESGCHSGIDELPSLQDSLSEVQEPVALASDVSLHDVPMDTNKLETSLARCMSSTLVGDVEPEDQELKPKEKEPMPRGRTMSPVPGLANPTVRVISSESTKEAAEIAVSDGKTPEEDTVAGDTQTEACTKSEESSIQSAPHVRGRVQRPKPNIQALSSARREKLERKEDIPLERTDHPCDVSQSDKQSLSLAGNHDSIKMESSTTGKESPKQDSSNSCLIQKDRVHESDPVSIDSGNGDIGKEKPSQPARGRLLKPKPNLTKAPAKNKPSVTEQQVHHASHSQDSEQASSTSVKSPSRGQKTETKQKTMSPTSSQGECKTSPIKPAQLARGRFQKPNRDVLKTSAGKENTHRESSGQPAEDSCMKKEDHSGQQETELSMCEKSGFDPTSVQASSSSEKDLCLEPLSPQQELKEHVSAPENQNLLVESVSQVKCKKSPIKPVPVTRGQLQSPKPNLMKATGRKVESEVKDDKSNEASSVEPTEISNCEDSTIIGSSAELGKKVLSDERCRQEQSSDLVHPVKEVEPKQNVTSPIKPAPVTRGRLQRPKPNLLKATGRKAESEVKDDKSNKASSVDPAEKISLSNSEDSSVIASSAEALKKFTSLDESSGKESSDLAQPLKGDPEPKCSVSMESVSQADSKKSPIKPAPLTRGRLQRPRPNLLKAACRRGDSDVKETEASSTDTTGKISLANNEDPSLLGNSAEHVKKVLSDESCQQEESSDLAQPFKEVEPGHNVIPEEAAQSEEPVKGPSVKHVRTRFPKARPNIGLAAVRKERPAIEPVVSASAQGEVQLEVLEKKSEEEMTISPTSPGSKQAGHAIEKKSTAIKPAQLKRFRSGKVVANLIKLPGKSARTSQSRSKEEVSPVSTDKDSTVETHASSPASKRKAECCEDVSKRSRLADKSCDSSETKANQVSLSSEIQTGVQSSKISKQCNSQHSSRYGQKPRKALTTTSPDLPKPSENSSEQPENQKTVRSIKPRKEKVSKPVAKKSKGKTTLVKIRATQQEEDEEEDAELDFEEENYDLAPDMVNQAPVFVPFSLRSPKYVPAEIEETVEELEIPIEFGDVASNTIQESEKSPSITVQHVLDSQEQTDNKGSGDGSAEAAVTLASLGSSVSQSNIGKLLSSNTPAVSKEENHAIALARSVDDHNDFPIVQAENVAFLRPDHMHSDIVALPFNPSYTSTQEVQQHGLMSQDISVTDSLLTEEATFILTLVEIPINEEYSYSCDSNSADSLPAPVLISSGSSQALTQPQNQSFGLCGPLASVSHETGTVVQEHTEIISSLSSRKRNASGFSGANTPPPEKKLQVDKSAEQQEECKTNSAAAETDCDSCSIPKASSHAVPRPKKAAKIPQSSLHVADLPVGEEKVSDCGSVHQPPAASTEPLNRNLPSACANIASSSKTPLKRPGRKPLGFLSLVCKDKQPKNAKDEPLKKKSVSTYKVLPSLVSRPQKHSAVLNQEDATTTEMPSTSTVSSPAVTQTTETEETITPKCHVSPNLPQESQDPAKVNDFATEEEGVSVSEYFFSDIFMEIDD